MFSKTIASQSLDAQPTTSPQTVDITFSYRYWTNLTSEQDLPKPLLVHYKSFGDQVDRTIINNIPKSVEKIIIILRSEKLWLYLNLKHQNLYLNPTINR